MNIKTQQIENKISIILNSDGRGYKYGQ
ncbi:hypothetical protein CNEO4_1080009 [Clostridium neonatale]|uniref:Uncharacterized protein n=1 Tax=Clostridium neonatale TaxID=137838 RepID=A0AA86JFX5_9CLOT|nr:hypothetical protein CNEO_42719 [Clostridium neonatale]CAI3542183.1 hypothetical protein CNEO4_1320009 [Clostridium neonatale]CAI3549376.1 hypothetical protein CNEO4_1160009 [Clostridium neonatale]CAI3557629.1 hypothetical protein CNEO4_1080009 [Clostridium neonatale]CAI3575310.1 hypothetical protein CNEO4_1160009 [Clostridium neonatale]